MIRVYDWLSDGELDAVMMMQVHDELVFEVLADQAEQLTTGVVEIMQSAAELAVPLIVDTGVGANWDQAH
jgi:DNA polymerase-1